MEKTIIPEEYWDFTGNLCWEEKGFSPEEWAALPEYERRLIRCRATKREAYQEELLTKYKYKRKYQPNAKKKDKTPDDGMSNFAKHQLEFWQSYI